VLKPYSANTLLFAVEIGGVNKGRVFGTAQLTVHALIMVFVKHLKMKLVVTVTIRIYIWSIRLSRTSIGCDSSESTNTKIKYKISFIETKTD